MCAVERGAVAGEIALRYAGKAGGRGRGRGDSEHGLKRARRKVKKLRKIDPEPSDKIVLLPKHAINCCGAGHGFGYYDVEPCIFMRDGVKRLGEGALANERPCELLLMDDEPASEMLGYRVWLGGEWDLCERYRFLAVVCVRVLDSIREQKELRKCLEQGDAACDMDEDDAVEGVRRDVLYPEEVINAKLGGYWDASLGLNLSWKDEHRQTCTRIDRASMACLPRKRGAALRSLGRSSSAGMRSAGNN